MPSVRCPGAFARTRYTCRSSEEASPLHEGGRNGRSQEHQRGSNEPSSRIANFFRSIFRRGPLMPGSANVDPNSSASSAPNGDESPAAAPQHSTQVGDGGDESAGTRDVAAHLLSTAHGAAPAAGMHPIGMSDIMSFLQPLMHTQHQMQIGMSIGPEGFAMFDGVAGSRGALGRPRLARPTPEQARAELQISGLSLAAHQVRLCCAALVRRCSRLENLQAKEVGRMTQECNK